MPLDRQYQEFSFDSYKIDKSNNKIIFHYSVDGEIFFDPEIGVDLGSVNDIKEIEPAVFNLGMAEIPSFYKAFCTPKIIVKA